MSKRKITRIPFENYTITFVPAIVSECGTQLERAHYTVHETKTNRPVMTPKWFRGGYLTREDVLEACIIDAELLQDQ